MHIQLFNLFKLLFLWLTCPPLLNLLLLGLCFGVVYRFYVWFT